MKHTCVCIVLFLCLMSIMSFPRISVNAQSNFNGDINGDGQVDLKDLVLFAQFFGSRVGQSRYNVNADLDGNQVIDQVDLAILQRSYGEGLPGLMNVTDLEAPDMRYFADDGIQDIYANVNNGHVCILGYSVRFYNDDMNETLSPYINGTTWNYQTMTENGTSFHGTINVDSIIRFVNSVAGNDEFSGRMYINYKVTAINNYGSNESRTYMFYSDDIIFGLIDNSHE